MRFNRPRDEIGFGEALTELARDGLSDHVDAVGGDRAYLGLVSGKVMTIRFEGAPFWFTWRPPTPGRRDVLWGR